MRTDFKNEQRGVWEQTARMNNGEWWKQTARMNKGEDGNWLQEWTMGNDGNRLQEWTKERMETDCKNEQRRGWEQTAKMNKGEDGNRLQEWTKEEDGNRLQEWTKGWARWELGDAEWKDEQRERLEQNLWMNLGERAEEEWAKESMRWVGKETKAKV